MSTHPPHKNYCPDYIGLDVEVPLLNGNRRRYVNFDNAASTPALKAAQEAVNQFLNYYSSVHRGTGYKSQLSTHVFEQARQIVMDFLGADPQAHTCIFVKNTTEAINKLARRFPFTEQRNVVLTSGMEHHSNDLPWRLAAEVVHVDITADGRLNEADFDRKLAQYQDRLALVAITGASNVTGYINPIHRLAEKTHAAGAQIMADMAQFAPHRAVDMRPIDDPGHLDYITISGHKMYAPFGTGALVGLKQTFAQGDPDYPGGGTVEIVTLDSVTWAGAPERDEAGSPNVIGAVALAAAIRQLEQIGMPAVAAHEAELTAYLLENLAQIPGLQVYGDRDPRNASQRLGSIPLNLEGFSHFLVAAILGHEFGIGVRNGCFCAHPYLLHILGLTPQQAAQVRARMLAGDRSEMPGLVRISFGLYNTKNEIDLLIHALQAIRAGQYQGEYIQDIASGEYQLRGWQPGFEKYFVL
ncbi:MAG: aminotransferase class V-fold PLP-dependent enzyme [Anaerolineales bacterium]|nr:aminotransferase class V-fold PLP-dependent enzyme [Anaerolineales bacterium]